MATIHVNRGGTSLGTFSEQEVRDGLRSGRFAGSDLGWREGMASWQPLSQFSEFAADISAGAPPTPPTPPPAAPPVTSTIAPAPVVSTSSPAAAPRSGLPWDERQSRGFVSAFFETLTMVLTKPGEAFTAMKREGGLTEPLIYGVIGGSVGYVVYLLFMMFVPSLAVFGDQNNALAGMFGMGVGIVFAIVLIPIAVAVGLFIGAAILHLCLMIVGGAKQTFETTFRVLCFCIGSAYPLMIVPFCGGAVAGIWAIVVECIGLARAHETDTGRAVLAVFLPLIVCCGGGFLLAMMFGMLGALGQHG